MSKVKADAVARKRSRVLDGTVQSEKKLAKTEVEIPYVQKPATKVVSSRNYKTLASTEQEYFPFTSLHEPKSLIPNRMEAYSTTKRRSDVLRTESAGSQDFNKSIGETARKLTQATIKYPLHMTMRFHQSVISQPSAEQASHTQKSFDGQSSTMQNTMTYLNKSSFGLNPRFETETTTIQN